MTTSKIRANVDPDLCIGNGMCRQAAPETFVAKSTGQSAAGNPPGDTPDALFEAAETCPVAAIGIEDAETGRALDV